MDRNHEQRRTRWNDEIARGNESQCSADWTSQVFPFLYSIIQDWSSVYLKSEAGSSLWKPMISHWSLIRVIIGLSGQSWRHKSMSIFSWFWLDGSYLCKSNREGELNRLCFHQCSCDSHNYISSIQLSEAVSQIGCDTRTNRQRKKSIPQFFILVSEFDFLFVHQCIKRYFYIEFGRAIQNGFCLEGVIHESSKTYLR